MLRLLGTKVTEADAAAIGAWSLTPGPGGASVEREAEVVLVHATVLELAPATVYCPRRQEDARDACGWYGNAASCPVCDTRTVPLEDGPGPLYLRDYAAPTTAVPLDELAAVLALTPTATKAEYVAAVSALKVATTGPARAR